MTNSNLNDIAVKKLVEDHWNGRASTFDDDSQHGMHTEEQHERWSSVLSEWIGETPLRVLDVGCGTGVISHLVAELGHDVIGVDLAPAMLNVARSKATHNHATPRFVRGDAEVLAVPDDTFDLVTARHLVWTLPNPESALMEWQRAINSEGRILLIEGYWDHDEPWDEYEQIHESLPLYDGHPPGEMRDTLTRAGLRDIKHEPLMDSTLWGREPRHEYYIMTGSAAG